MEGNTMRSKLGPGVGLLLVSLFLLLSGGREAIAQSAGLTTFVNVDRGCGATYRIGNPIRINFGANKTARLRLVLQKNEFTPVTLFDRVVAGSSSLNINGTIGQPAGAIRKLTVIASTSSGEQVTQQCNFMVRSGTQDLLMGSVSTNKGCGVAFGIGEAIRVIVNSSLPAHARVTLTKPNGAGVTTTVTLFDADVSAGDTVVFNSTIGSSLGTRTLRLLLTRSDTNSVSDNCGYDVITALSPGP
jgi:hypothetical protein